MKMDRRMALPELIEIVPLDGPVSADITVPGSKSITNRALILAALADGPVTLRGALWSEDTQIMTEALRQLGFEIAVEPDEKELCNRTIRVAGWAGAFPTAGRRNSRWTLFVGNAGTAARFLAALVCLGRGVYRLHGTERMQRTAAGGPVCRVARHWATGSIRANDRLPADIFGAGPRPANCRVDDDGKLAIRLRPLALRRARRLAGGTWKANRRRRRRTSP